LEGALGVARNTAPRRDISMKEARHGSDKRDYLLEPVTTRGSERLSEEIEKELEQRGVDTGRPFTIYNELARLLIKRFYNSRTSQKASRKRSR
jgi:hypothetical protein